MFTGDMIWLPMSTLTSGVASVTHRIAQWFTSQDIDDSQITHSLPKVLSQRSFITGGFDPSKDQTDNELDELERLERRLAARYNMAHAWGIDSVEVFGEAKARAFSERTPQLEQELRQMTCGLPKKLKMIFPVALTNVDQWVLVAKENYKGIGKASVLGRVSIRARLAFFLSA
ncbi:hypothetical protein ARMSODRAFT_978508 [Armillaria solidipes]|uniref:Uncharacterized protein n=1 Tax=Armillaria solidipes TaxID=1076256 RepID=A0A2H3BDH8_9AGAR|nr:hypothetical protein ARMSODRAFT_978508 [Armillaria solidipes]